jgi:hypothetical protein
MGFNERVDGRMQGPNMPRSADLYSTVHTHVMYGFTRRDGSERWAGWCRCRKMLPARHVQLLLHGWHSTYPTVVHNIPRLLASSRTATAGSRSPTSWR